MPATLKPFGQLKDGRCVDSILLSDAKSGFSVEILEYGATIRAIRVPDASGRILNATLSYPTLSGYENGNAYLGATIGRCAGRTATGAHAMLPLSRNEGLNHLHGGTTGFSHSLWKIVDLGGGDTPAVRLRHRSPAGEDGYPGAVTVDIEFALIGALTLRAVIQARTDADSPLNLTLHPYFNLSGDPESTIDDHYLHIDSAVYLPLDPTQLPTGEMLSVQGTPFDFRAARPIDAFGYSSHAQLCLAGGYDHYYVLRPGARVSANVFCPRSSLGLRIGTNQKGLQFYSGCQLDSAAPTSFALRSGLCLEPHAFPNAINESRFPGTMLRARDSYRHEVSYEFYRGDSLV